MPLVSIIVLFLLLVCLSLAEELIPGNKYLNNVVNRNISKLNQQDWQWLRENCGLIRTNVKSPVSSFKIIGGERVKTGQMPWSVLVSIVFNQIKSNDDGTDESSEKFGSCTGTLISKQHLITNAHCFLDMVEPKAGSKKHDLYVPYDTDPKSDGPYGNVYKMVMMFGVTLNETLYREESARFLSPDFLIIGTYKSTVFDYAIMEFEPPLTEDDLDIASPACLPFETIDIDIGTKLVAVGWGDIDENGTEPDHLMYREATRIECRNPEYKSNFICTDQITSDGDSGAGFIKIDNGRAFLVGIHKGSSLKQTYGVCLDPDNPSALHGVRKPIQVINEKLGCIT